MIPVRVTLATGLPAPNVNVVVPPGAMVDTANDFAINGGLICCEYAAVHSTSDAIKLKGRLIDIHYLQTL